jgi:outer membrane protein assembly factor BamB
MQRPIVLLAAAALALCPPPSPAADADAARWPQFRGPDGLGVAPEGMRLPAEFGPSRHVVWQVELPPGHSSPCIWGGRIFLTGFDRASQRLETLCLDRGTGRVLWRRPAPAHKIEHVHRVSSPAASTPACDGRRVYVYFGSCGLLGDDRDGKVYCASASGVGTVLRDGPKFEVLARNDLGEPALATPALVDGKVYVRTQGHLYAFGEGGK